MNNVTAIIVAYNTADLLRSAYESLRRFYPTIPVVIIDNSDLGNPCRLYTRTLSDPNLTLIITGKNIGHGGGMKTGIEHVKTEYFLLMDSDVTIDKAGVLGLMLVEAESLPFVYGVGQIIKVDKDGMNANEGGIRYLHPHFALIKKEHYKKFSPIINHGAPFLKTMIELNKNTIHKVINFPVSDYITHHERGTRVMNPRLFHPKYWDRV